MSNNCPYLFMENSTNFDIFAPMYDFFPPIYAL